MQLDLGFWVGAGEGNRTLMTSLEGVPHGAVVGADLHVGVAGGSRGLPLLTLANGTTTLVGSVHGSGGRCCLRLLPAKTLPGHVRWGAYGERSAFR
jgi:hypothetical protein